MEKRGREAGRRGLPPTDGLGFDAVETEVVGAVLAAQEQALAALDTVLSDFRHAFAALDVEGHFTKVRIAAAGGLSDLKAELQFKVEGLSDLRQDLQEAEAWYQAFRARHRLGRPGKSVSRVASILQCFAVLACLALTMAVYAELLGKTGALGWVDTRIELFTLAALNIGIALIFALYAVPPLWHRFIPAKLFGLSALIAYLALTITFNLAMAHYRETPGNLAQGAGEEVLQRLLDAPFGLDGEPSLLLWSLGTLFSLTAFVVGLNMRELYPGYARAIRQRHDARTRLDAHRDQLIDEFTSIRTTYEGALAAARAGLTDHRDRHDGLIAQRDTVLARFSAYQDQLENDANALLKTYHDANIAARPDEPPPRFNQPFKLARADVAVDHDGEWSARELKAGIKVAQGHLDWLLLDLQRLYEAGIADQVTDPDFVDAVEELARLARDQGTSVAELAKIGVEMGSGARDWPPTIALGHEQLPFPPESAEMSAESREQIRTTVMQQVLDLLKRYPVDIIEVVGHTDEQPVRTTHGSSLDDLAIPVLWRREPASSLLAADNAGLGLARAIAVATELAAIGPDRVRIVPLSAAQLLLPGDTLSHGRDPDNHLGRRRIEIRLRKSTAASAT